MKPREDDVLAHRHAYAERSVCFAAHLGRLVNRTRHSKRQARVCLVDYAATRRADIRWMLDPDGPGASALLDQHYKVQTRFRPRFLAS